MRRLELPTTPKDWAPSLSLAQAEAMLELLTTGASEARPNTMDFLSRQGIVEGKGYMGNLTWTGREFALALLALQGLVGVLVRYAARNGREHVLGDDGFEGKFLAWLGGVGDHVYVHTSIAKAPAHYQGICLLIAAITSVRSRICIEFELELGIDSDDEDR